MSTEAQRQLEEARRNFSRLAIWRRRWLERFPLVYAIGFTTPSVIRYHRV